MGIIRDGGDIGSDLDSKQPHESSALDHKMETEEEPSDIKPP